MDPKIASKMMMITEEWNYIVGMIHAGDTSDECSHFLLGVEKEECPEIRECCMDILEDALSKLQPTMNESAMMESHGRALTLYRTLCKEQNVSPKI